MAKKTTKRPPGRPRKHPKPDPNEPKRPRGRPKGSKNKKNQQEQMLKVTGDISPRNAVQNYFDFSKLSGNEDDVNLKERIILSLIKNKNVVSTTCREVGIERKRFYRMKEQDLYFAEYTNEVREILLDFVEAKLIDMIEKGDKQLIMFYLKTQGKDRGYEESIKQEVKHTDGSININIIPPNENNNE